MIQSNFLEFIECPFKDLEKYISQEADDSFSFAHLSTGFRTTNDMSKIRYCKLSRVGGGNTLSFPINVDKVGRWSYVSIVLYGGFIPEGAYYIYLCEREASDEIVYSTKKPYNFSKGYNLKLSLDYKLNTYQNTEDIDKKQSKVGIQATICASDIVDLKDTIKIDQTAATIYGYAKPYYSVAEQEHNYSVVLPTEFDNIFKFGSLVKANGEYIQSIKSSGIKKVGANKYDFKTKENIVNYSTFEQE